MKLRQLYEFIVKEGIKQDPRGRQKVSSYLKNQKSAYSKLSLKDKKIFDREKLTNPYSDTRILYGRSEEIVKRILVGIDIDAAELLLADRLREEGRVDCVLSHHPQGYAYASFYEVMNMQIDLLTDIGIADVIAKDLLDKRMKEVERKVHSANHQRAVDVAKLLDIPFLCAHTASDNFVASYLQRFFKSKNPNKLGEIIDMLNSIPEYKMATTQGAGPKIILGDSKKKVGKISMEMTGGTEGPKNIFARLSQAGISTIICMHLSEEHFKSVSEEHINVIIAGHISSDTLGLNLLLDRAEKRFGSLEVVSCSGFRRIRHI